MTILAQPNDCHSCNDARSIVQKKSSFLCLLDSQHGSSTSVSYLLFVYSLSFLYYFVLLVRSSLLWLLVSGSSLVRSQPGHTVRLVPYLPSSVMFFLPLSLPLLPLLSSSSVFSFKRCWPKEAIPKVATPWDPQVVCSSHVDSSRLHLRCLCSSAAVPPIAAGCLRRPDAFRTIVSWHSPLHLWLCSLLSMLLHCSLFSTFLL